MSQTSDKALIQSAPHNEDREQTRADTALIPAETPRTTPLTLLLDAHNIICRMYYGTDRKTEGTASRAIRSKIQQLIEQYKPEYVIAGIDSDKNFREDLHANYKRKNRKKPEALRNLLQEAPELMQAAGAIPVTAEGHEADDVLATLASRAPGQVVIVTGDNDLYGVVDDNIQVYDLKSRKLIDADTAQALHHGVPPHLTPFYKALIGDVSDRIPRVPTLTHEEAANLVITYQSPELLFANLEHLSPELRAKFRPVNLSDLQLYVQLGTLNREAPIMAVTDLDDT